MILVASECLADLFEIERKWLQDVEASMPDLARLSLSGRVWLAVPSARSALASTPVVLPTNICRIARAVLAWRTARAP